jgi:hypothetical protein
MKLKRDFLDAAFSDYIRWRDHWICRRCGGQYAPPTTGLHCAHIVTRGNPSTRHADENAIALCYGCHQYFTGRPLEFKSWCQLKLGTAHMERLEIMAHARAPKLSRSEKQLLAACFRAKVKQIRKTAGVLCV